VKHFTYPSVLLGVMYSDNMLSSSGRRYNVIIMKTIYLFALYYLEMLSIAQFT
jgi:hypothetical protein